MYKHEYQYTMSSTSSISDESTPNARSQLAVNMCVNFSRTDRTRQTFWYLRSVRHTVKDRFDQSVLGTSEHNEWGLELHMEPTDLGSETGGRGRRRLFHRTPFHRTPLTRLTSPPPPPAPPLPRANYIPDFQTSQNTIFNSENGVVSQNDHFPSLTATKYARMAPKRNKKTDPASASLRGSFDINSLPTAQFEGKTAPKPKSGYADRAAEEYAKPHYYLDFAYPSGIKSPREADDRDKWLERTSVAEREEWLEEARSKRQKEYHHFSNGVEASSSLTREMQKREHEGQLASHSSSSMARKEHSHMGQAANEKDEGASEGEREIKKESTPTWG